MHLTAAVKESYCNSVCMSYLLLAGLHTMHLTLSVTSAVKDKEANRLPWVVRALR